MARKKLILIRHAHRDTQDREADNGLSAKGRMQAAALLRYYSLIYPPESEDAIKPRIMTSPKQRCVETVSALAQLASVRLVTSDELLEQGSSEKKSDFRDRVKAFLDHWKTNGPELLIVCSHGDWLPLAVEIATGGRTEFKKGAWAEVSLRENRVVLSGLVQGMSLASQGV